MAAKKNKSKKKTNSSPIGTQDDKKIVGESFYASPLYDFLFPFRPAGSQWVTEYVIVLFVLIIKSAVGLGPYSGMGTAPMFGDFEAQRHWLEITQHLPISEWYWFDLQYWGLDYPPLTAYHSYILGKLGSFIYPKWFALNSSRGMEEPGLKTFMRFTVLASEALFYIPAIVYFTKWIGRRKKQSPIGQFIAAAVILFQPALILIDHGHFQYNSVMLGLTVYAINNLLDEFYALSAICFVFSICFKQMSLYYAPIFFAYLLSKSLFFPRYFNIPRFLSIAVATILSFGLVFAPLYLSGGIQNVLQAVKRIFPFARGIFEDKVANFWCVSNVILKYKINFTQEQLQLYSLILTLVGFLPSLGIVLLYPKKHLIPYALAACSMSFFLFSFQVHEKTILVPLLPITLLYTSSDRNVLAMSCWINNVALFTLWPLLRRDGLVLQYFVVFFMSNWMIGNFSFGGSNFLPSIITPSPYMDTVKESYNRTSLLPSSILWKLIIITSYICMTIYFFIDFFVPAPQKYPDIYVIFNCALGFGCFVLFWFWTYYKLFTLRNKTIQSL